MPRIRQKAFLYTEAVPHDTTDEYHNEVQYPCVDWLVRRAFSEPLSRGTGLELEMREKLATVHVLSASSELEHNDDSKMAKVLGLLPGLSTDELVRLSAAVTMATVKSSD